MLALLDGVVGAAASTSGIGTLCISEPDAGARYGCRMRLSPARVMVRRGGRSSERWPRFAGGRRLAGPTRFGTCSACEIPGRFRTGDLGECSCDGWQIPHSVIAESNNSWSSSAQRRAARSDENLNFDDRVVVPQQPLLAPDGRVRRESQPQRIDVGAGRFVVQRRTAASGENLKDSDPRPKPPVELCGTPPQGSLMVDMYISSAGR